MKQHYIKFSVISVFLLLFFTNENLLSAENSRTVASVLVVPTVTTTAASSVTSTSATLGGNVTIDGGSAITERGIVYSITSENSDPEVLGANVTKIANGTAAIGTFLQSVSGLTAGTQYSFKAYATNDNGTSYGYGVVTTFTTVAAPAVTTTAASSITSTSATIGGDVTSGTGLTERGIVYSITSENGNPQVLGANVTKVANGTAATGTFSQSITGLSVGTEYSFNAYVTNNNGTTYSYGDVTTFTTTGKKWAGTNSTDWADADNWTPSGVPTASDDVIIPDVSPKPVISAAGAVANNLTIEASSSLTIQSAGSLTVSVDLTNMQKILRQTTFV